MRPDRRPASRFSAVIGAAIGFAMVAVCVGCTTVGTYFEPSYWPTAGWRTTSPEEQGMDSALLADMLDDIAANDRWVESVHVVRNGYLVLEAYRYPFGPDTRHIIHSCTKSIVSILVGIAIDKGYIAGVDERVLEVLDRGETANPSAWKKRLEIEHLLTMTTGLDSRDSYLYRWEGLQAMRRTDDWVGHILDVEAVVQPGKRFDYSNMASFLLSAIVSETSGRPTIEFAHEHLFGPLGITDVEWPASPRGINMGWGEMRLLPSDLAKIGLLYLSGGSWDAAQIVPARWVEESTSGKVQADTLRQFYGYQWWIDPSGDYMALGYGGQYLIVSKEHDLVVAFTSALGEQDFYTPYVLYRDYVQPAVGSHEALPASPDDLTRLQGSIESLAEPPQATAPARSETAQVVTGRLCRLESNPFGLEAITLFFDEAGATVREHYAKGDEDYGIGLDGRFISNDTGESGAVAVRGNWVEPHSFRIEYVGIGLAWRTEITFTFEGATVSALADTTSTTGIRFSGTLTDEQVER